jgi:hypothetical protein
MLHLFSPSASQCALSGPLKYVTFDVAPNGADRVGCNRGYKDLAPTEPIARRAIDPIRIDVLRTRGHRSQLWVIREPSPATRRYLQKQFLPLINRHEFSTDRLTDISAQRPVQSIIRELFQDMRRPTRCPGNGKNRREKIGGNAERIINGR